MTDKNINDLEQLKKIFRDEELHRVMAINLSAVSEHSVSLELKVDDQHLRPGKIMNGGVSLLLIETAGSYSSYRKLDTEKQNALGIQVNANHLGIAFKGDILTATSTSVHLGKTTHVWDVNISNQNGKLISSGRVTLLITKK